MKTKTTSEIPKIQRQLKNLGKRAIRKAANLIKQDLKSSLPVRSGALKRSLATKVDSKKGEIKAYGIVGPRSKFKMAFNGQQRHPARYAAPLEAQKHLFERSWKSNNRRYLDTLNQEMAKGIQQVMNGS